MPELDRLICKTHMYLGCRLASMPNLVPHNINLLSRALGFVAPTVPAGESLPAWAQGGGTCSAGRPTGGQF
jgi:hypothetical protein